MKSYNAPYVAGIIMVVSGLVHGITWAATGESWEGPLSIRKPILFGISTGVTLASLGWIQEKLKPAAYDKWLSPLFAASLLTEVGFITAQYWRGEASHFNHDTSFDLLIDRSITILIVFASIVIVDIARRSFSFLDAQPSMKLAIRGGMAFLLISCGLGFFILFYGEFLASRGRSPTMFGKAGVMKFPHGITIHAVQYLPMFAWLMTWFRVEPFQQFRAVSFAIASLAALLVFSLLQTFRGLDRFDVDLSGIAVLAIAAILGCVVLKELFAGWPRRMK